MLADEVISLPSQPDHFNKIVEQQRIGYHALAEDVLQAERFVLQRDAVFLIHSVCQIPTHRLTQAIPICRLPFPRMWVELTYKDRQDWHVLTKTDLTKVDEATAPSRLGFYIEQQDAEGRVMKMTLVWRHNDDPHMGGKAIVICGFDMVFNANSDIAVTDETREEYKRMMATPTAIEQKVGANRQFADPRDNEAALELEERISTHYSVYMAPLWQHLHENFPDEVPRVRENAIFDLLQEWRFLIGLLIVLNSRNIISYSAPMTFEKLNKARKAKRVPPLHSHREIRLGLSNVQRNRLGGTRFSDVMAHLVRGHFKIRRTGLFWWSPHVRGRGEAEVGTTYVVKTRPNLHVNL